MDLFVANDTVENFLFLNKKNGKFEDIGLQAGVAFSQEGRPRSGMGVDSADFDQDGRLDFATTGYYTPGYFLADHPQVLVFYNRFGEARRDLVCPSLPWVPAPGRARQ